MPNPTPSAALLLCASLSLLSVLSACLRDETLAAYGGQGPLWQLQTEASAMAAMTLGFSAGGRVYGQAGCLSFSARNTTPYPWIGVENVKTKPLGPCQSPSESPNEALNTSSALLAQLAQKTEAEISGPYLILRGNGPDLLFTADVPKRP